MALNVISRIRKINLNNLSLSALITRGDSFKSVEKIEENLKTCATFNMTPLEARLSALHLQKSTSNLQLSGCNILSKLKLPTLDQNNGTTFYDPVTHLPIEEKNSNTTQEKFDPVSTLEITEPNKVIEKMADNRMILIRRRKMRRHKLRKLRKRMKFVFRKRTKLAAYNREVRFQEEQMKLVYAAEAFNASEYVQKCLEDAKEKPPPKKWRGMILPEEMIKNIIENEGTYIPDQ